jgi:hypothetical protein
MTPAAAHCFQYVECDIPPGVTLDTWRRDKARDAASRRHPLLARLRLAV